MAENVELVSVRDDSDRENLLHLIERICPQETEEPTEAYKTFCEFALTELNIKDLASEQGIDLEILRTWAEDYGWTERLKEWNLIFQVYQRKQWQAREKAILEHWNDRRQKFLETADLLLAKADLLFKHPHVEKVIYNEVVADYKGQVIPTQIVISPVKWQVKDIAALQKTAISLLKETVGDREIMIDRLTSDGYVITELNGNEDIGSYVVALEKLEELQRGF